MNTQIGGSMQIRGYGIVNYRKSKLRPCRSWFLGLRLLRVKPAWVALSEYIAVAEFEMDEAGMDRLEALRHVVRELRQANSATSYDQRLSVLARLAKSEALIHAEDLIRAELLRVERQQLEADRRLPEGTQASSPSVRR